VILSPPSPGRDVCRSFDAAVVGATDRDNRLDKDGAADVLLRSARIRQAHVCRSSPDHQFRSAPLAAQERHVSIGWLVGPSDPSDNRWRERAQPLMSSGRGVGWDPGVNYLRQLFTNGGFSLIAMGGRKRKETRRSGPLTWCSVESAWQPVRDSNPCRHLERATETVRLVLSDAVLCGLSRANATRRVASCRPISASTAAWSGSWIGKMSSRGEGVA